MVSLMTIRHLKTGPYLDSAGVRLESSGGVFGGHSALDGTAVHSDLILFEVELCQAAALTHVQLGVHQVHTVKYERGDEVKD